MDSMRQTEANRVYEDFEPSHSWDKYNGCFTVTLPGFRREQMKVQVTSKPALRLMGERHAFQNRWLRFKLEFPVPSDYDTDSVTATFEGGKLTVKFPKITKPEETIEDTPTPRKVDEQKGPQEETAKAKEEKKETKETTTNTPEEAPGSKETSQKADEQEGKEKAETKTNETTTNPPEEASGPKETSQKADKQEGAQEGKEKAETKTNEVSDKNISPHKKDSITEKNKAETEASMDKVTEKVGTNGSTKKTDAATSEVPKTKAAKSVARSKTRLVDFTLPKALSNQDEDEDENEALGDSTRGLKKWKKLVAWVMLILLVVGLGLYYRKTFGSSQGEFNFEDMLLFPY